VVHVLSDQQRTVAVGLDHLRQDTQDVGLGEQGLLGRPVLALLPVTALPRTILAQVCRRLESHRTQLITSFLLDNIVLLHF